MLDWFYDILDVNLKKNIAYVTWFELVLSYITETDLEGCEGVSAPLFFNHLFFCNNFEELQTVLIKVKLIINNAPLTYVYPNTIKTYLISNYLLFGSQTNTKSTIVNNITVLPSTTASGSIIGIGGDINM